MEVGFKKLIDKMDDPNFVPDAEGSYETIRSALFDKPIDASDRLFPSVKNWRAAEPLYTVPVDESQWAHDWALRQPPSPGQAVARLIGRVRKIQDMDGDEFANYKAEARDVIRPEEIGKFLAAVDAVRNGKSYAIYIDDLTEYYVPVSDFQVVLDFALDSAPIIGDIRSGVELYDKFEVLQNLYEHAADDPEAKAEFDKKLMDLAHDVALQAAPGVAKKLGRIILDTPAMKRVKEKILQEVQRYGGELPDGVLGVHQGKRKQVRDNAKRDAQRERDTQNLTRSSLRASDQLESDAFLFHQKNADEYRKKFEEFWEIRGRQLELQRDAKVIRQIPAADSFIWKNLSPWRDGAKTNGLAGDKRRSYTWDFGGNKRHGSEIEVWNSEGYHMMTIDPLTGRWKGGPKHPRRHDLIASLDADHSTALA